MPYTNMLPPAPAVLLVGHAHGPLPYGCETCEARRLAVAAHLLARDERHRTAVSQ